MNYLDNLTEEEILTQTFPIEQVLLNSLFYPSSAFDGGVVKYCNTTNRNLGIINFIYCDFAFGEDAFNTEMNTFLGYGILASRSVSQNELIPNGWQPVLPPRIQVEKYEYWKHVRKPFIKWVVYERDENRGEPHGPKRFSLLYVGGEGVATFQALYWTNHLTPKALAIIQPGTGFGMNWTDFHDYDSHLAWVLRNNPTKEMPDAIYYGGIGSGYDNFKWPNYKQERIIRPYYNNHSIARGGEVRLFLK